MEKVLLVSPIPPPIGGMASWSTYILDYFEHNDQCELVHYNSAVRNRRLTQKSILQRFLGGYRDMRRNIPNIVDYVKRYKPDLVHITTGGSYGLFRDAILISRLSKSEVKTVVHFHFGRIPILALKNNWEWKLLCLIIKKADKAIVIDKYSYTTLLDKGFTNIEYLANPIYKELEDQERGRALDFTKRLKGSVLYVGQVIPYKGVIELVSACADMESIDRLTLIGQYEKETEQLLKTIAIKRGKGSWLSMVGSKDHQVVLEEMRKCNVFVLPSYSEGFPYVILEAMLTGCPIVATSVGAIEEMLNIKDIRPAGICVKPQNIEELKTSISSLVMDSVIAEQIGVAAKQRVLKEYTMDAVCNKLVTIWSTL